MLSWFSSSSSASIMSKFLCLLLPLEFGLEGKKSSDLS